jgi:hypothetical protein
MHGELISFVRPNMAAIRHVGKCEAESIAIYSWRAEACNNERHEDKIVIRKILSYLSIYKCTTYIAQRTSGFPAPCCIFLF